MPRLVFHCAARYASAVACAPSDIAERVERLLRLRGHILDTGESIYKDEELYYAEVQPGLQMWQLLYDDENAGGLLSRDSAKLLRLAIDQAVSLATQDIMRFSVRGALGLFSAEGVNALNNEDDWRDLVRSILVCEPVEPETFCMDFEVAFPKLKFSELFPDCISSFEGGHESYVGVLVRALSALNDFWTKWEGGDLPQALRAFSAQSGFATTLEGNGDRKAAFTFLFKADDELSVSVLCEPHMKLADSDMPGDNSYHFHRVYFCPRPHDKFIGKVLVGHAGKHL